LCFVVLHDEIIVQLNSAFRSHFGPNPAMKNRASVCPTTSDDALVVAFGSLVDEHGCAAFSLHEYETMERNCGASAKGLFHCRHLLRALVTSQPTGRLLMTQLRNQIEAMLQQRADLIFNRSSFPNKVWLNFTVKKIMVLLHHWRNVSSCPILWERIKKKLKADEVMELETLLRSGKEEKGEEEKRDPPRKKQRTLMAHPSAASSVGAMSSFSSMRDKASDSDSPSGSFSEIETERSGDSVDRQALEKAAEPLPAMRNAIKAMVQKKPARASNEVGAGALGMLKLQIATKVVVHRLENFQFSSLRDLFRCILSYVGDMLVLVRM
jgi:hypothetical protein